MRFARLLAVALRSPLLTHAQVSPSRETLASGTYELSYLANSNLDLRNPAQVRRLAEVFRQLHRLRLPAVVHLRTRRPDYGAEDVRIFAKEVLSQAPGLPLPIAHMAGWGGYDEATDAALGAFIEVMAAGQVDRRALTFDLGAVVFQHAAAGADTARARDVRDANAKLAARIRQLGVDRVLFATVGPPGLQSPIADKRSPPTRGSSSPSCRSRRRSWRASSETAAPPSPASATLTPLARQPVRSRLAPAACRGHSPAPM